MTLARDRLLRLGGPAPLLRLDFARERYWVGRRAFRRLEDAGLVTSRSGALGYVDRDGLLKFAPSNVTPLGFNLTTRAAEGAQVWPVATNIVWPNNDFTHANFIKTGGGTGSAAVVTASAAVGPDGVAGSASRLQLALNGGTTAADISPMRFAYTGAANPHNIFTGVWLKSNTAANYTLRLIHGATTTSVTVTPSWQRFTGGALARAATTGDVGVRLKGDEATSDSADVLVHRTQGEYGSFASPDIDTTTAPVTRGASALTLPLGTWFNPAAGAMAVKVKLGAVSLDTLGPNQGGATFYGAAAGINESLDLVCRYSGTDATAFWVVDGGIFVSDSSFTPASSAFNSAFRMASRWSAGVGSLSFNGAAPVEGAAPSTLPTVDSFGLGQTYGSHHLGGGVMDFEYRSYAVSDGELRGMLA